jgi:heptosyltransferase III
MESSGIIISRTDNLGDVVLTLPVAGLLKQHFPDTPIFFVGKAYTEPVIKACEYVDFFLNREEVIAKPVILKQTGAEIIIHVFPDGKVMQAASHVNIPVRIATSHRLNSWLYANTRESFSRKNTDLHEAQLNTMLLRPLGFPVPQPISALANRYGLTKIAPLPAWLEPFYSKSAFNLILHPKSKGSAREWPSNYYLQLCHLLNGLPVRIFITGTAAEGEQINRECPELLNRPGVTNLCGRLNLTELMAAIANANGLVACSTGPLHLAAALGIHALGIYPPMTPIHPGRWAPIGPKAQFLVENKTCNNCRKTQNCACLQSISPGQVSQIIYGWLPDANSESSSSMDE